MPQTKETRPSADRNTAESSEKKQQVPAVSSSKTDSAAKGGGGSSKVSGVTGPTTTTRTSAIISSAETVKITTETDVTGKTEVREHRYFWVSKLLAQIVCLTIILHASHFCLSHNCVLP